MDDQTKALRFYTETLGLVEKTDVPVGEARWLTVVSPDDPDGIELLLEPDSHPAAKPFKQALVDDGIPWVRYLGDGASRIRTGGLAYTIRPMVPEAELKQTEAGLVPASDGWFVVNARDARWFENPGRGHSVPLTGWDEYEAESFFPMLGMAIRVVGPGEPTDTYHWETEQEDFLVLSGEALLIVEGRERPLKQWDIVHCPPETRHAFAGAGDGPCVLLCASSRQFQKDGPWGYYCADDTAARYNASSPEDTQDGELAYARFGAPRPTRYRDGLLPEAD